MNERRFCVLLEDDLTSGEVAESGLGSRARLVVHKPAHGGPMRACIETFRKGEESPFRIQFGPLTELAPELGSRFGLNGPRLAGYLMKQRAPVAMVSEVSAAFAAEEIAA